MEQTLGVRVHLNAKLQPQHRFLLEDELQKYLQEQNLGDVTRGGTLQDSKTGEIISCDIELELLQGDGNNTINEVAMIINKVGVPKGSFILYNNKTSKVGELEGMAIYLNGTDLPKEVYVSFNVNDLIEKIEEKLGEGGRLYSWWEGAKWRSLYFYGTDSFETMVSKIETVLNQNPLCEGCEVRKIA